MTLGSVSLLFPLGAALEQRHLLSLVGRFRKHVFRIHDQEKKTQRAEFVPLLPSKVRFLSLHFLPEYLPFPRLTVEK